MLLHQRGAARRVEKMIEICMAKIKFFPSASSAEMDYGLKRTGETRIEVFVVVILNRIPVSIELNIATATRSSDISRKILTILL